MNKNFDLKQRIVGLYQEAEVASASALKALAGAVHSPRVAQALKELGGTAITTTTKAELYRQLLAFIDDAKGEPGVATLVFHERVETDVVNTAFAAAAAGMPFHIAIDNYVQTGRADFLKTISITLSDYTA